MGSGKSFIIYNWDQVNLLSFITVRYSILKTELNNNSSMPSSSPKDVPKKYYRRKQHKGLK